jgi:filamentous hemagglutinin family protein
MSTRRPLQRRALLAGVSVASLLAVAAMAPAAQAGDILRSNRSVTAPVASAVAAQEAAIAQAALMAKRSQETLLRTTMTLQAVRAAQSAARQLALTMPGTVPNGLKSGGLQVVDAPVPAALDSDGKHTWDGAALPTESTAAGRTEVTVKQTKPKAILSWKSFNVGKETDVHFDQTDGGAKSSQWIALNRIVNSDSPSTILGSIRSEGQVYLINNNGIIFGGSSQVDVHGLVASSLDIGLPISTLKERNSYFLNANDGKVTFSFQYEVDRSADGYKGVKKTVVYQGCATIIQLQSEPVEGDVVVQAGASIKTPPLGKDSDALGEVVLAAPNVVNAGSIETPDGQTMLVAARHFTLYANDADLLKQSGAPTTLFDPNLRGSILRTGLDDTVVMNLVYALKPPEFQGPRRAAPTSIRRSATRRRSPAAPSAAD